MTSCRFTTTWCNPAVIYAVGSTAVVILLDGAEDGASSSVSGLIKHTATCDIWQGNVTYLGPSQSNRQCISEYMVNASAS